MGNDKLIDRELNLAEKEVLVEKYKTALKKNQFINEIRNGLGDEIKKNGSRVIIHKKPIYKRVIESISKLFTKF
jgi:hypothetical protein